MMAIGNQNKKVIHNSPFTISRSGEGGFTLVEVIMYSAILAIFIGGSFIFISTILGNTDNLLERNEIVANEIFLERKIGWLFSRAKNISIPTANSFSTTTVRLEGSDTIVYPAIIAFDNDRIILSLGGQSFESLTNNRVKATSFLAEHYSSSQSTSTLKISLTLQSRIYSNIFTTSTFFYVLPK